MTALVQIISIATRLARRLVPSHTPCDHWRRDPLAHPALNAMSVSQLADLPAGALRACCGE